MLSIFFLNSFWHLHRRLYGCDFLFTFPGYSFSIGRREWWIWSGFQNRLALPPAAKRTSKNGEISASLRELNDRENSVNICTLPQFQFSSAVTCMLCVFNISISIEISYCVIVLLMQLCVMLFASCASWIMHKNYTTSLFSLEFNTRCSETVINTSSSSLSRATFHITSKEEQIKTKKKTASRFAKSTLSEQ